MSFVGGSPVQCNLPIVATIGERSLVLSQGSRFHIIFPSGVDQGACFEQREAVQYRRPAQGDEDLHGRSPTACNGGKSRPPQCEPIAQSASSCYLYCIMYVQCNDVIAYCFLNLRTDQKSLKSVLSL